jgi:integrase
MAQVYQKAGGPIVAGRRPWYIDYVDAGGKRHRERTDAQTKAEAEAVLRARLSDNARCEILGVQDIAAVRPTLLEKFYTEQYLPYLKTRVRASTYSRAELLARHVLPVFGSLTLRAINAGHVEEFMRKRAGADPKPSAAEINRERSLLSAILNTAFRRGLVDVNPVGRVRPLREDNARDRWLTPEEVVAIVAAAEAWVQPISIFAVNTGMRVGEICGLRWADVDSNPGFVRVGAESKGHKARYIPLNSASKAVLEGQTRHIGPEGAIPWVFTNPQYGEAYRPASVYHDFKRAAKRAGLEDWRMVTFHTTRHTFASWLIQKGVPVAEVQQYLGHSTDTITRRYAHLAPATGRRHALEILVGKGTDPAQALARKAEAL